MNTKFRNTFDQIAQTYDRRYKNEDCSHITCALFDWIGKKSRPRVLEVGCGTGHWLRILGEAGISPTGVDFSWEMLLRARKHEPASRLCQATAENLPFADKAFDRIFCINSLRHFSDKASFITETSRVLRPSGGFMTIDLDPHTGTSKWWIYDFFDGTLERDRERYPSCDQIRACMKAAGYVNCQTWEVQQYPSNPAIPTGRWAPLRAREALAEGKINKTITPQLALLTNEEFQRGIEKIYAELDAAETCGETLYLKTDLRVYATAGALPGI